MPGASSGTTAMGDGEPTGIYLLVGPDPDDRSRALASIGEGDNVLKRLLRHNTNEAKGFWERIVVMAPPRARAVDVKDAA